MYPENNGEMMPKLYLGSEQTMETNPTYAFVGCPKKRGQFETDTVLDMEISAHF